MAARCKAPNIHRRAPDRIEAGRAFCLSMIRFTAVRLKVEQNQLIAGIE
jgi:hypothetical protein